METIIGREEKEKRGGFKLRKLIAKTTVYADIRLFFLLRILFCLTFV